LVAGIAGIRHHIQIFIGWDGVLQITFCPGWPTK
jgi:hypothetical protein